ncbi:MAG: hypothetical protein GF328_14005 [Candidatus Latescibacteria bacterium]|nr:hypothetical protein [Candidatus Latescibacterota bacterium]
MPFRGDRRRLLFNCPALVLALLSCAVGLALANDITGNRKGQKPTGKYTYTPPAKPRQGGDTIAEATIIPALPYSDSGSTVGYAHDYDEACPYGGSLSPDVVYSYTPSVDLNITIDLCASSYDTKVYVYAESPDSLVACNDDAGCGETFYQSFLEGVGVFAGTTYYIVVDGYDSDSGEYQIDVTETEPPPPFECPEGAFHENEPACQDDYVDHYNGGCNSTPPVWQTLVAQEGGCATMCGYSCAYLLHGAPVRDTDWFESFGTGSEVTVTAIAEFPLQLALIYGTDCDNLQFELATAPPNTPVSLSHTIEAGAPVWTWIGPSVFNGVPESQYQFEICGIQDCEFQTFTASPPPR